MNINCRKKVLYVDPCEELAKSALKILEFEFQALGVSETTTQKSLEQVSQLGSSLDLIVTEVKFPNMLAHHYIEKITLLTSHAIPIIIRSVYNKSELKKNFEIDLVKEFNSIDCIIEIMDKTEHPRIFINEVTKAFLWKEDLDNDIIRLNKKSLRGKLKGLI